VPHSPEERITDPVEPGRLRLIMLRLGDRYYDVPPASDRIATCVLADLTDSNERPSLLS
jgi:hypothetical protein